MTDADGLWLVAGLHGPTRGDMAKLVRDWRNDLELSRILATVGSSGHWPHCLAFWTASSEEWIAQLQRGLKDDFDEERVWWGETVPCRLVRGAWPEGAGAFLIERVVASGTLEDLDKPDVVFGDLFTARSGFAIWGAQDFSDLGRRQEAGIGSALETAECDAWWATVVPEREMV